MPTKYTESATIKRSIVWLQIDNALVLMGGLFKKFSIIIKLGEG